MKLFEVLDLETKSSCNRTCPTCLRNSHPDRERVATWFKPRYMPMEVIKKAVLQCEDLGFTGRVCLSHYNEPLMDERLPEIAEFVHSHFKTFFNTNGDFLSPEIASRLDGVVDRIIVSLYMSEPVKSKRAEWILSLFNHTHIDIVTNSTHATTHYSPNRDLQSMIDKQIDSDCRQPRIHCIINHEGNFLVCCDDFVGNFGFGKFPEISIEEYWNNPKHVELIETLSQAGGRRKYSYCSICPR